jgi:hypothetical protein
MVDNESPKSGEALSSKGRMKESRQHPRVSLAVDVDVASGSNFYAGRTRDLSLGGLFVETEVGLTIGLQVEVKLKLPKGTSPCLRSGVVAVGERGRRRGVRFLELRRAKRAIGGGDPQPGRLRESEADEDAHAGGASGERWIACPECR